MSFSVKPVSRTAILASLLLATMFAWSIELHGGVLKNYAALELVRQRMSAAPGDYCEVIRLLEESQMMLDNDVGSHLLLALANYWAGNFNPAISALEEVQASQSSTEISSYWLGHMLWDVGRKDRAVNVWRNTRLAQGALHLARRYLRTGDYDKAKERYEFVLMIQPENSDAWFELGKMLWDVYTDGERVLSTSEMQRLEAEIGQAFTQAVRLDPEDPSYLDRLGWYYFRVEGNKPLALEYLERAKQADKVGNPWIHYHLGLIYSDLSASLASFRKARELYDGEHATILKDEAAALYRLGSVDEALDVMSRAGVLEPERAEVHFWLAILYAATCQLDDAEREFDLASGMDPEGQLQALKQKAMEALDSGACGLQ